MKRQAYISERVVTPAGIVPAAVLVDGEKILAVVAPNEIPGDATRHDFGDTALLPGLIDSHVHINEPGRTEWEGFFTATRAAAAGGYTLLVDMPLNSLPATTTLAALELKRAAARAQCRVDCALWGGVVADNQVHLGDLAAAGVPGFKCFLIDAGIDGFQMVNEEELRRALPIVARSGLPLLVHAELAAPVEAATARLAAADWRRYETYLQSRPDEAELSAIDLLIRLCREYRFRLRIVHLSTSRALEQLRAAKSEGLPITVETCPHYLHFAAEEIADGATLLKCAPPLRTRENREKLWQGLRDGIIDLVASDHSPCPPEMKRCDEKDFQKAWGGIASVSVALPVTWTAAEKRGFTLSDIARWMADEPATLAGCGEQKGKLAAGYDADLLVFAPEEEFLVTEEKLHYRHRVSPYLGARLRGVVQKTFLRGQCIFDEGEFPGEACGKEIRQPTAVSRG
jgi:allantoinase